jgi:geranylgeranyl pyrophosphate synthase
VHGPSAVQRENILKLLCEHRTIDRVRDRSCEYAMRAKSLIEGFPPSPTRDALLAIPDYVIDRDH